MIDLHIHTIYSDGEYNEYEILEKIKQTNISEFAICDHDTIEGCIKVNELVKDTNLIFHTGIELSCTIPNFKNKKIDVHLLVRDFNLNDETINDIIKHISSLRNKKIERMLNLVKKVYNIEIKQEEIENVLKTTNSIGKPHIYQILCTYGNYDREEYYKYMRDLNNSDLKLNLINTLSLLKNIKCYTTLAHPIEIMNEYGINFKELDELLEILKQAGLDALETKHSKHTKELANEYSKLAKKHNLKETQGSDYHGPTVKPDVILGKCYK